MSDLATLKIWDDPALRDALSWYLGADRRAWAHFASTTFERRMTIL